jgi:hypothetical protein
MNRFEAGRRFKSRGQSYEIAGLEDHWTLDDSVHRNGPLQIRMCSSWLPTDKRDARKAAGQISFFQPRSKMPLK